MAVNIYEMELQPLAEQRKKAQVGGDASGMNEWMNRRKEGKNKGI